MYTNGLKDRFGSPLISKNYADDRYVKQENLSSIVSDLSTYNRYETNYFSKSIQYSNATVSSFRFGYKHFPHGLVKRVSLYSRDAITSNIPEAHTTGCYLMANVYKKDGTLVSSTSSTNKLVAQFSPYNSSFILNTWEFDGLVTPKEDEVIKFIPSPDGVTQVANYNLGILVDYDHTHEDCGCGGDDDFVNDPLASGSEWLALAIIEGDFIHDNENQNHFRDSTKHLNSVERGVIESLYTPTNVFAWDNNFNNETLGATTAKGFIISRPYITNGKFKEVRWTSSTTTLASTAVYIKITLRDTNGAPIKSYVSNNSESFDVAGLKSYRFDEEWEIDDSISSISFETCGENGTVTPYISMSLRIIGDAVDNDSDGSESTYANYKINVQFYKIDLATNKFTSHVGDNTHLTTEQKNTISSYLSHVGDNTHLTKTDRKLLSDLANNRRKTYDWTPHTDIKIQFSLPDDYTIPVNGWLVINSNTVDDNETWSLSVNNTQLFNSDQRGNLPIQILLSKNDVISTDSTTDRSCYFLPCKSEVLDYRVTKTPYDIWAFVVVEDENGNFSIQNFYVPDASSWKDEIPDEVRKSIIRVEDEVAYDANDNLVCNIQSSGIVNGANMFEQCTNFTSFSGDLSNLISGRYMFRTSNLSSFNSDLSSLINGDGMFAATKFTSFTNDLSSLINGLRMFFGCQSLTSFTNDLSSLINGDSMFIACQSLTSFNGDLRNLLNGYYMFSNTNLNEDSIQNIADTIQDINELDKNDDSIWQYPSSLSFNEDGSYTWTYSTITQDYRGRLDLSYDDTSITDLTNINNSIAQIKAKGWTVYLDGTQM